MSDIAKRNPPALEGELLGRPTDHYLQPADDLEFVLHEIQWGFEVNDPEHDPAERTEADLAVVVALAQLRVEILRRQAVKRGPNVHVEFCGAGGDLGTACGPNLGLPLCGWHGGVERQPATSRTIATNATGPGLTYDREIDDPA